MSTNYRASIILLGLGPGTVDHLTREAWMIIEQADEIWLRTRKHPVVDFLPKQLRIHSFDYLYEELDSFENVYASIVERIIELGKQKGGIIYAVPGHPFVAEATCTEIVSHARIAGLKVQIVEGLSFIEPTLSLLEVDPLPQLTLVDALELGMAHMPSFPPSSPALVAQIYSREIASNVKLTLSSLYPDQHPVKLVHSAGMKEAIVESLHLYEIDRSPHIDLLTSLYIPPLGDATSFEEFQDVIARLRAPDGCAWDREQTHQSLRADLLEEAYEVLTAIDDDDPLAMREEFGDLLLLIVMHSQIASEYGEFTMSDVLRGINTKIVNRHPHVFGELEVNDASEVLSNWERIKAEERVGNGKSDLSILDGGNLALPALLQAYQYQTRVARVGFDWTDIDGVWNKIYEEIDEIRTVDDQVELNNELGDLLFTIVNLARWLNVDPESALRLANDRFKKRFNQIESVARAKGKKLTDLTMDEMDAYWEQAKHK